MYKIDFDARDCCFTVTASGFWSVATAAAFAAECLTRGAWVRARHGRYAILVDARDMPVQSGAVARAIEALIPKVVALSDAPYAFVAGSMLLKLQADRVLNGANCRNFTDMVQARAWLVEVWPARQAA